MTAKNSDKTSTPETVEYINHEDKRHRRKEHFLRTMHGDFNKIEVPEIHEGDHHIEFRISPKAEAVGCQVAKLFNMSLNQYAKATLYLALGLIYEPTDRRRKRKWGERLALQRR